MHTPGMRKRILAMILMLAVGGCGTERYEQRLVETQKLIEHQNKLDENLGRAWSDMGVEIRMPKQFSLVPPPAVEKDENGEVIDSGPDPRQPSYMSSEFPGLLAAFQGTVEADVAGEFKPVPAYAYVLGNHPYWLRNEIDDANAFHTLVLQAVVEGLGLPQPLETEWQRESYPRSKGYVAIKDAQVWRKVTSRYVDETTAQVSMHLFKSGDIMLAVIFVYPSTIDPNELMQDRIDMALETLKISDQKPTPASPGSSSSAAGQNTGTGF